MHIFKTLQTLLIIVPSILDVFGQSNNPCSTLFWECRSGVAHFKGSPALSIFGYPQTIAVEFDATIKQVMIEISNYKVSVLEIKGSSVTRIKLECPQNLEIDQLCQSLVQPNPNMVEVIIVNTNLTINQFQDCSQMSQSANPILAIKRSTIYMKPESMDKSQYMSFKLGSRRSALHMTMTRVFDVAGIEFRNYYDNVFLTDVVMENRASFTCIEARYEEGKVCVPVNMGYADDPTILHYPDQPTSESTTESAMIASGTTRAEYNMICVVLWIISGLSFA